MALSSRNIFNRAITVFMSPINVFRDIRIFIFTLNFKAPRASVRVGCSHDLRMQTARSLKIDVLFERVIYDIL